MPSSARNQDYFVKRGDEGIAPYKTMKKFKFTLQSLLKVKESLEKQQKSDLAVAQARLDAFVRELGAMETRLAEQRAETGKTGAVTSLQLAARDVGFRALYERIDLQKEKVSVAETERQRVRVRLTETMRERKMLEKLRETQQARYKEEVRREEAKAMDDYLSNQLST